MTTRTLLLALAAFLAVSADAAAQNGMSVLSRYGIGELNSFTTGRQRGMGHVSVPLASPSDISVVNPAAWSAVDGLRLQGDLVYEYESYAKNSNLSYGGTAVKGLQFSFPVEEELRTRLVFGFLPLSRVNYKLSGQDSVSGTAFTTHYLGSGGISTFRFGGAMQPASFLRFGAALEYSFGTIDQSWEMTFQSTTYFNTLEKRSTTHRGLGGVFGVLVTPSDNLTLGASFTTPVSLTATRDLYFQYLIADSTEAGTEGTVEVPLRWGVGASWSPAPGLLTAVDYSQQAWGDAQVFSTAPSELRTQSRLSVGAEWYPGAGVQSPSFWRRLTYRAGLVRQSNYVALNNIDETETLITAGLGVPLFGQNRMDLALEYGWRGDDASLLGSRSLFRFSVSFSVGEGWFIRKND
jgi:hypothetical protein